MAEKLFLQVLNMSITASWVILAVLAVRFLLRKLPKKYSYVLWAVVGFRLLCPFSIASVWSLFNLRGFAEAGGNRMEYVPLDIGYAKKPQVNLGAALINNAVNTSLPAADPANSVNPLQIWIWFGNLIWILGIAVMLLWAGISFYKTKKTVRYATKLEKNVYECGGIDTPFVLGLFKPVIYVPYRMQKRQQEYILAHEQFHIGHGDLWVKMLAFLMLVCHWFNPLVWIAFSVMTGDMEMRCDEAVISRVQPEEKKEYSTLLLSFSAGRKSFSPGPLAFGESDAGKRIRNILHFRNPKGWMRVLAMTAVVLLTVVCVTNGTQKEGKEQETESAEWQSEAGIEKQSGIDSAANDTQTDSDKQQDAAQDLTQNTAVNSEWIQAQLQKWTKAFCERDGETILEMSSDLVRKAFAEKELLIMNAGESGEEIIFGMSSPWPWNADSCLVTMEGERQARILYYAITSDPHVTVWEETVTFGIQDDSIRIEEEELHMLDYINSAEEFSRAYPYGIDQTMMDYLANGLGEALNSNALLSSNQLYQGLFEPERAAVILLNLLDNAEKVQIRSHAIRDDAKVDLMIHFASDGGTFYVTMVQPYGENGIWVVQDLQTERYSNYREYEKMLGDGFLQEFYELEYNVTTDIADGLEEVNLEVYTGNIGDGDSGYVLVRNREGQLIYDEFAHAARAGWNNIYLSENNWLMTVHLENRYDFGDYRFKVFRLDEQGNVILLDAGEYSWNGDKKDGDYDAFTEKLQQYLRDSYLLLSTQEGELNTEHVSEAEKYTAEKLKE